MRVLVEAAGAPSGVDTLGALSSAGYEVIASDMNDTVAAKILADDWVSLPPMQPDALKHVDRLLNAIDLLKIDAVYFHHITVEVAATLEKLDPKPAAFVISPSKAIRTCLNKALLYAEFPDLCPQYMVLDKNNIRMFRPQGELCVKPLDGEGSRGFYRLGFEPTWEDWFTQKRVSTIPFGILQQFVLDGHAVIVCDYLHGQEISVDVLCYRGDVLSQIQRKRLWVVNGIANASEMFWDPELARIVQKVVERLNLSYVVNLQFIKTEDGDYHLIDANPRPGGGYGGCGLIGLNYPAMAVELAVTGATKVPYVDMHAYDGQRFYRGAVTYTMADDEEADEESVEDDEEAEDGE